MMSSNKLNVFKKNYAATIDGHFKDLKIATAYVMNQCGFNIKAGDGVYLHPTKNGKAVVQKSCKGGALVSFKAA